MAGRCGEAHEGAAGLILVVLGKGEVGRAGRAVCMAEVLCDGRERLWGYALGC